MNSEKIMKWVNKALEDFKLVEHELTFPEDEMVTSLICFHCQQFVEKALKAYLYSKGVDFGRTHNLEFLLQLCIKEDKEFQRLDIGDLTFYSVEVRYPDEFYIPPVNEAKEAYGIAQQVKLIVFRKIGIKLDGL